MSRTEDRRDTARRKAQDQFTKSVQREDMFRQEREKSRTANVNKMARLRDLRIAKEAAEKEASDAAAKLKGETKSAVKRPRRAAVAKRAPV